MKRISLVISIVFLLVSCKQSKEITSTININTSIKEDVAIVVLDEAYTLMKNNCYACHNPNSISHDSIIAPPFAAIKQRYNMQYNNKEEFVNAITDWALNPNEETALMRGAVREFKVMPKLFLPKNKLEKIATYMYENNVEQPEWFEDHFNKKHGQGMGMGKGRKRRKTN